MISVAEASSIINAYPWKAVAEAVEFRKSLTRVLAETIVADRDFPPFNRVAMDGIALNYKTYQSGQRNFKIEGMQLAGQARVKLNNTENCIEVMTGAPLPEGTDTVIRYEDLVMGGNTAQIQNEETITSGQNIHRQGADCRQDQTLLTPGMMISAAEVALLASLGKTSVKVFSLPQTAIISTGDEMVDVNQTPELHQIRKSNSYALEASFSKAGIKADHFHLADTKALVEEGVSDLLKRYDLLVFSGGVSKGKFDFIPEALKKNGAVCHFHQVAQKPGKPMWFGTTPFGKTVFALPGNPVSTFLCFYKYIRPWLLFSMGIKPEENNTILAKEVKFSPPLTYFLQVRTEMKEGKLLAYPIPGGGSGDFVNLKEVDGFLELPAERDLFKAGEVYRLIPFR